jgi:hypothetical protein
LGLADIKRSYALLPTPAASYYLGESALVSQQYQQAASYFKQAIAAGGEIGKRSLQQLNEVRLQIEPQLFLSAQLSLTEEGYLLVTTKNNSSVSMAAIQLQLSVPGDGRRLTLPQTIPAGRELRVSTGIGPITDADKASQYRVRVVTAKALK